MLRSEVLLWGRDHNIHGIERGKEEIYPKLSVHGPSTKLLAADLILGIVRFLLMDRFSSHKMDGIVYAVSISAQLFWSIDGRRFLFPATVNVPNP